MLLRDWRSVYRHAGGRRAALRCLRGTWRIQRGKVALPGPAEPLVDCVTFSVIPIMTALWSRFIRPAIPAESLRVLAGDCSGTLDQYLPPAHQVQSTPLLNYHHGKKLDLYVYKLCRAEYVVVTDDDIFWLNTQPWQWAIQTLESDPRLAVVSLLPKKYVTKLLDGKVPLPMGSCFVLRRDLWLREQLSFQLVHPPPEEGHGWFYDTGEYAQVQLLRRGYKLSIAPAEIQDQFVAFEGMSTWTLKIRANAGDILANLRVDPSIRPEKVLRTIYASRGLAALAGRFLPPTPELLFAPNTALERAEAACRSFVAEDRARQIQAAIDSQIGALEQRLRALQDPGP